MAHHTSDRARSPQAPNAAPVDPPHVRSVEEATGEVQVEIRTKRRAIIVRLVFLIIMVIALYILWPSLLTVFETWPELLDLNPAWFVAMVALEGLSSSASGGCSASRSSPTAGSGWRRRSSRRTPSPSCRAVPPPAVRYSGAC